MSDVTDKAWIEEFQRKVFNECVTQSHNLSESINESSSTSKSVEVVPVTVIVKNIHESFAEVPYFRFLYMHKNQRLEFLEDLRKTLQKDSRDNLLNWIEFKNSSSRWFVTLLNLLSQDGNNNVRANHRDVWAAKSERSVLHSTEEHSCNDTIDDDSNSYSINQMDTVASSYSVNNSSIGFSAPDSIIESSEETDHIHDYTYKYDRIIDIKKETISLRDEVSRLEEANASLEYDIKLKQKKLEQVTDKLTSLQKEYDEQREALIESEQREQLHNQNFRKLEKVNSILQKKNEDLEANKENILSLQEKINEITKENLEYIKQITDIKNMYDEKVIAYEYLQGQYNELQVDKSELEKFYEKNNQHQQEKIEELQNLNLELQSKMNRSDNSSRLSLTPPPYSYLSTHIHSTPYSNNKKIRDKESLYSELKASGFNLDDAHIQDVKDRLSFYNEEIANIVNIVDEALQDIAASRNEICVPNLQLVEIDIIENLKYKIITLVNSMKPCATSEESCMSRTEDDSREKPDVLPEMKKTNGLANDRVFVSEKRERNSNGSVTSTITSMLPKKIHSKCNKSTTSAMKAMNSLEDSEAFNASKEEIIVPLAEALNRIMELKGADNTEEDKSVLRPSRNPKQKSIHTIKKNPDWPNLKLKKTQYNDASSTKSTKEYSQPHINAKGDGPHYNIINRNDYNSQLLHVDDIKNKKIKSALTNNGFKRDKTTKNVNMRLVTIRPTDKTYSLNPVVSSSEGNSELHQLKSEDSKSEATYCHTPTYGSKTIPHRKLSIYERSFDIDNLQTPSGAQNANGEKKLSISTLDIQEIEYVGFRAKSSQPLDASFIKDQSYRCPNTSNSSNSVSSKYDSSNCLCSKSDSSDTNNIDNSENVARNMSNPIILAPSKFKFSDSVVNQSPTTKQEIKQSKQIGDKKTLHRNSESDTFSGNIATQQSRILSSSTNLINKEKKNIKNDTMTISFDSRNIGSSTLSSEFTNTPMIDTFGSDDSVNNQNVLNSMLTSNVEKIDQTYTKKGVGWDEKRQRGATVASGLTVVAAAVAAVATAGDEAGIRCSSGNEESSERAPAVERAMSSGEEDSSAESECDARPPENEVEPISEKRRHNNEVPPHEDKVEALTNVNGVNKEINSQKIISNSLTQEVIKEDEGPKAFPSWTDERLQESGIASFPDIDSEISENLSEDELKKKYTAFSVGLSTDRMTLSKRMILSRRYRDQAEKNFTNEVFKMQQDVKELTRQRNSVSGRVPGLRRPSLCFETPKWEIEKLDRTDSSSSITELREIFEHTESRRHSQEENNNLIRMSFKTLSTNTSEYIEGEELWSNLRDDIVPELSHDNEIISPELGQHYRHPLICWLWNRYVTWKPMLWCIFIAFLLGLFINRVVSSSKYDGPPTSWWSIEEILKQYIQVKTKRHPILRPI